MIRKAYIIGTVALGMALAALQGTPVIERLASSARSFEQNFRHLQNSSSLDPVERVVFSLVLTSGKR